MFRKELVAVDCFVPQVRFLPSLNPGGLCIDTTSSTGSQGSSRNNCWSLLTQYPRAATSLCASNHPMISVTHRLVCNTVTLSDHELVWTELCAASLVCGRVVAPGELGGSELVPPTPKGTPSPLGMVLPSLILEKRDRLSPGGLLSTMAIRDAGYAYACDTTFQGATGSS